MNTTFQHRIRMTKGFFTLQKHIIQTLPLSVHIAYYPFYFVCFIMFAQRYKLQDSIKAPIVAYRLIYKTTKMIIFCDKTVPTFVQCCSLLTC